MAVSLEGYNLNCGCRRARTWVMVRLELRQKHAAATGERKRMDQGLYDAPLLRWTRKGTWVLSHADGEELEGRGGRSPRGAEEIEGKLRAMLIAELACIGGVGWWLRSIELAGLWDDEAIAQM